MPKKTKQSSRKNMTNVEFVSDLMEFGPLAPIVQAVVIEALRNYTGKVAFDEAKIVKAMANNIINGEAWVGACREIAAAIKEKYGS